MQLTTDESSNKDQLIKLEDVGNVTINDSLFTNIA